MPESPILRGAKEYLKGIYLTFDNSTTEMQELLAEKLSEHPRLIDVDSSELYEWAGYLLDECIKPPMNVAVDYVINHS